MSEQHIGKYRIEERLGSGAFASVYRCFDPDLESICAIKVLADNWSEDESARNWFLNEARIMFGIEHPSILRIFTSGVLEDSRPYFVMEYANRGSLADLNRARREHDELFSISEALEISIAIAEGLVAAHARGLVHRDLKPSNILFRDVPVVSPSSPTEYETERQIKLADFGLARRLEQGANSLAGAGTPHYIAPEQARGLADERPDVRNDIYSAATMLYEMLAGRVPFPYGSMTQVINAHLNEEPPPLRKLNPGVPDEIAQLVHSGLAKAIDERVPDANSWRDQLKVLRAALNPDGSIMGWPENQPAGMIPAPILHSADSHPGNATTQMVWPDAANATASTTLAAPQDGWDRFATGAEAIPEERGFRSKSSSMAILYLSAAITIGLLVVGILGFALADLVTGNGGAGLNGLNSTAGIIETESNDDTAERITSTPTPTAAPEVSVDDDVDESADTTDDSDLPADATSTPEPTLSPEPAADVIAQILEQLPGTASSAVVLPSGEIVEDASEREAPAASTIKLWIAAAVYEDAALGQANLEDQHTISGEDQAFGTGILNSSEYIGRSFTYEELVEIMLLYSDNTAANVLVDWMGGMNRVNEYTEQHGYESTRMQRLLGELDPDQENYTSAGNGALFMERLLQNEIVDAESSRRIRSILEQRAGNDTSSLNFFGRNLPGDVRYAHISGVLTGVRNEIGYYIDEELDHYVVISVMLGDLADTVRGEEAIASAVGSIHSQLADSMTN